ncbi:MAG: hypothetical protein ABID87_07935 [Chloroflexota bacterium]
MSAKAKAKDEKLPELNTFLESVNKKETVRNGKKVRFNFVKRKRKN